MVEIKQHTPEQIKLFGPDDNFIGLINNNVEMLDVRVQIAEQKLTGYYFTYGNIRIDIKSNGGVINYPEGLYGKTHDLCTKLYSIQKQRMGEIEDEL